MEQFEPADLPPVEKGDIKIAEFPQFPPPPPPGDRKKTGEELKPRKRLQHSSWMILVNTNKSIQDPDDPEL